MEHAPPSIDRGNSTSHAQQLYLIRPWFDAVIEALSDKTWIDAVIKALPNEVWVNVRLEALPGDS